ncbi:MAG TPA: hypothetical protein H9985_06765 [Candidatus Anaerofilum faecale]|nr:hypothetical protein [Anaerofilum sp. An201]OUP04823.1 hypothetical protein B5F36_03120 [Anaerofilum sp. An201]HIX13292.1 hypothetical protein [Candidatus Anaerofilum faecale]
MPFTPKLTYKNRPLVRCGKELYYGSMADPSVVFIQILTTKKVGDAEVADRVQVMLLSTDTTKAPPERVQKSSARTGLYSALDIGSIWLDRAAAEWAKQNKPKA